MKSFNLFIILICLLLNCIKGKRNESSEGVYKVYQIVPLSKFELMSIFQLYERGELDFWSVPSMVNNSVDIMVSSGQNKQFLNYLAVNKISTARIVVDDLAKLIADKEGNNTWQRRALKLLQNQKLRDDNGMDDFGMPMGPFYYSYSQIVAWMNRIEAKLPTLARVFSIGKTVEGRDIYGIRFGNHLDTSKRVIWIDAGIHAREWTTIHTATYFIYLIANQYGKDPIITQYLNNLNIVIMPVLNPDGYEYTRSGGGVGARMWRKNRSKPICFSNQYENGKWECCSGVDLNRNFDFRFGDSKAKYFFPCGEMFEGTHPFSEPESRAVRDTIMGREFRGKIDAFITLHAFSQKWMYPYSDQLSNYPNDVEDLKMVARRAVLALRRLYGTRYDVGTSPEIMYSLSGGSFDWAKETANIKYSYLIELRPYATSGMSSMGWGFVLDPTELMPTARETWEGVRVVIDAVNHANLRLRSTSKFGKVFQK